MRSRNLLERLGEGPVICAEGYVFELERRGYVQAGPYVPEVVMDHPGAVTELHREFLRAGSDVILALTYYAHRDKLKLVGREGDLEAINRCALQLAKDVAEEGDGVYAVFVQRLSRQGARLFCWERGWSHRDSDIRLSFTERKRRESR